MPLDARSVVDFLLERGELEPEDVLDRGLSVTEVHRRNENFAVRRDGAPGLFVKQSRSDDDVHAASLHREAVVARAAANDPAFARVAALSPALRRFDGDERVLVLELVDGEDLNALAQREGGPSPAVMRAVGEAVGALHRDVPRDALPGGPGPQPAWILSLPLFTDAQLPPGRPALRDLRRVARDDPSLGPGLAELRETWRSDVLVHGDLKWDNVMVVVEGGAVRVRLVDWELGAFGDAAWDVGGLLHAHLRAWVGAMPADALAAGRPPDDLTPLRAMAPAIAASWAGYRAEAAPDDPAAFLLRAVRFAGARLLQTAFEHVHDARVLTGHAVGLAQLAANVVAWPQEAARTLFGLAADGAG